MGKVSGMLSSFPEEGYLRATIDFMVAEATKTSEIEGEFLSRQDVMSSIRNKLGLNDIAENIKSATAAGAGELMVLVRNQFSEPLTPESLFEWHAVLLQGNSKITAGAWRSGKEPMQIVSGAYGKWHIHFEAPPSDVLPQEMSAFINWFNDTAPGGKCAMLHAPVRAAVAHLYFESIHPFEDGNGRIGRAIAEKALSQTLGRPVMLSLSQSIERDRRAYYNALMSAQQSNNITPWISYFVDLVLDAQDSAVATIRFTLKKTTFFDRFSGILNSRQEKALHKMFAAGPAGFVGGLSAAKYVSITDAPKATATRDLQNLLEIGALTVEGGGRSTRYYLAL